MDIEDSTQLIAYLRTQRLLTESEPVTVQILAGGVSNRTMLVTRANNTQWVIKQALAKLRVKADWFSDPIRIHREAAGLQWLEGVLSAENVPQLIFDDHDNHIIGMTAIPQPHENWKMMLLRGEVELDLVRQFAQILANIHQATVANPQLKEMFADRAFFESLRVEPYYAYGSWALARESPVPSGRDETHAL